MAKRSSRRRARGLEVVSENRCSAETRSKPIRFAQGELRERIADAQQQASAPGGAQSEIPVRFAQGRLRCAPLRMTGPKVLSASCQASNLPN